MASVWTPCCSPGSKDRTTRSGCRWYSISRCAGYPILAATSPHLHGAFSLAHRDPSLLTETLQDLYNSLISGFTAMQFAVFCSDGWSAGRRQLAQEQASLSVFGDAPFVHLDARLCSEVGAASPPRDAHLPFWSSVPALFVSGTLDSNTPACQAEEILWGFANGGSVSVENGFHETLPSPDVQAVVAEFFSGADLHRKVVQLPPLGFLTIEEAKASPQATH
jgi:hypothetical protein